MRKIYLRFIVRERHKISQEPKGLFSVAYELDRNGALTPSESAWWATISAWFARHLPAPETATRSSRPNAPNRAIFWFKASARGHVSRMREVATLLETHGVPVEVMKTDRPGYVVYEDDFQVAAEPFRGAAR